jgi:NAD(P)-dependent dehydrogenase (short-subunit alcohol dehydrogenase family)
MTQAFAPVLAANGGGAFVNVLSVVSWAAFPSLTTYSASKAAAWSFTNAARVELSPSGTEVVGVHVGFVDTDLTAALPVDKIAPEAVAASALDALEQGQPEALVDDLSRGVKANLHDDQNLIYPGIADQFHAATELTTLRHSASGASSARSRLRRPGPGARPCPARAPACSRRPPRTARP